MYFCKSSKVPESLHWLVRSWASWTAFPRQTRKTEVTQCLNLNRLDNTLKNNVLWPDGWMKMAWVSRGMNIANGKISRFPCQGEILYNEPYCWREESHVQPFIRLYVNSFVQKVQQPTYSFLLPCCWCPVLSERCSLRGNCFEGSRYVPLFHCH